MASTEQDDAAVEKFARNGGSFTTILGGLIVVGGVVAWAVDMDDVPLWAPALALFVGALIWTSTVRPQVLVRDGCLELRNMLSTVRIPLAAIEEIAVQQVMAVRTSEKRYVCAGVGRSLRQVMKGSAMQRSRQEVGGLTGEVEAHIEPGIDYGDFVETRVRQLIKQDRTRRGIRAFSPEVDELARQVRREPAWPEIAALIATGLFLVAAVLVT